MKTLRTRSSEPAGSKIGLTLLLVLAGGFTACASSQQQDPNCGAGTHPDNLGGCAVDIVCGPGTHQVDNICLPDPVDGGPTLMCGPGTHQEGETCVSDGSSSSSSGSTSSSSGSTSSSSGSTSSSSGSTSSSSSSSSGGPPGPVAVLPYEVVDAAYSRSLDRIVMAATAGNALHIYDPIAATDVSVSLPLAPACVAVSPDGTKAIVGHNAWVTYVDLQGGTVIKTIPVSSDIAHIALGASRAYGIPRVDQWVNFDVVDLNTLAEVPTSGFGGIYADSLIRMNLAGDSVYVADIGLSPQTITRYTVTGALPAQADESPFGMYPPGGNMWVSNDGHRVFGQSAVVYRASSVASMDLTYAGAFANDMSIQWADSSAVAGQVAVIPGVAQWPPGPTDADAKLHRYDDQFLQFLGETPLPDFPAGSMSGTSHGRYVFFKGDGSKLFVVLQADPSLSALHDYGVTVM